MFRMLVGLVVFLLFNLLLAALLLWLCCKLFRVQRPGEKVGIGFRRVLLLTVVLALVSWALLGGLLLAGQWIHAWEPSPALAFAESAVIIFLHWFVLRYGLPTTWLRSAGVWLSWTVLRLAQVFLVLLLTRQFFFEAFVFPTGSMADTLLGYHKDVVCPHCGMAFAVNASVEKDPPDGRPPFRVSECVCPNCRHALELVSSFEFLPPKPSHTRIKDPGVTGCDRLLVAKHWLTGGGNLERFDLITFKYPGPAESPGQTIIYLKRVIGLPGEMVAIRGGKLWVLSPDQVPAAEGAPAPLEDGTFTADAQAMKLFEQGKFRLLRKSPELVIAYKHLVYDDNHVIKEAKVEDPRRWNLSDDWLPRDTCRFDSNTQKVFRDRFSIDKGQEVLAKPAEMVYEHVHPGEHAPELISDFMAYNVSGHDQRSGRNWVADLMLECKVEVLQPIGNLTLDLARGPDRFLLRFDLAEHKCALIRQAEGKPDEQLAEAAQIALTPNKSARIRFANVDERLTVWFDERLLFGDGIEYRGPVPLVPDRNHDLRPVVISTTCPRIRLGDIRIYRDRYYTVPRLGHPAGGDVPEFHPTDPQTWKSLANRPFSAYRVTPESYFVLGDNSQASADSRFWGAVPAENVQGKALLRYFPLSRLGWLR